MAVGLEPRNKKDKNSDKHIGPWFMSRNYAKQVRPIENCLQKSHTLGLFRKSTKKGMDVPCLRLSYHWSEYFQILLRNVFLLRHEVFSFLVFSQLLIQATEFGAVMNKLSKTLRNEKIRIHYERGD